MKRLCVVAAGTVALMSSAMVYAGGCAYSDHASSDTASSPLISSVDDIDANRAEELKVIEGQVEKDAVIDSPVVYN